MRRFFMSARSRKQTFCLSFGKAGKSSSLLLARELQHGQFEVKARRAHMGGKPAVLRHLGFSVSYLLWCYQTGWRHSRAKSMDKVASLAAAAKPKVAHFISASFAPSPEVPEPH
jgi:hypothetical protein